jgi:hypothetical protein
VNTAWAEVSVETSWDAPTRRRQRLGWLGGVVQLVFTTLGDPPQLWETRTTSEPKWRLVVQDGDGTRWAESAWRRDWPEVERLQTEWQQRLGAMPESEARSQLWRWSGT